MEGGGRAESLLRLLSARGRDALARRAAGGDGDAGQRQRLAETHSAFVISAESGAEILKIAANIQIQSRLFIVLMVAGSVWGVVLLAEAAGR